MAPLTYPLTHSRTHSLTYLLRALRWLLRHVWPAVRAAVPSATLTLAGAWQWRAEVSEAHSGGIEVLGSVHERGEGGTGEGEGTTALSRLLLRASVVAAPALLASPLSTTAHTALTHGVPLVTTPLGGRGLLLGRAPGAVATAKTSTEFAAALATLLVNRSVWEGQRERARRHAAAHLGTPRLLKQLRRALHELVLPA